MKFAKRAFSEFEMIRQQLGDRKGGFGNAAPRVTVCLPNHMIELVRHQARDSSGIDKFLYFFRFFPQRGAEEGVQGSAVDINKRKNHSIRHCTRGKREGSAHGVFETGARFGGTARASQANKGGEIVFRGATVHQEILPFHTNRRRLEQMIEFLLHFERDRGRDERIRCEKDDQSFLTRRERLRAAYAGAHAKHAGEGEDVCDTRHSKLSVVQAFRGSSTGQTP